MTRDLTYVIGSVTCLGLETVMMSEVAKYTQFGCLKL